MGNPLLPEIILDLVGVNMLKSFYIGLLIVSWIIFSLIFTNDFNHKEFEPNKEEVKTGEIKEVTRLNENGEKFNIPVADFMRILEESRIKQVEAEKQKIKINDNK
ncbi:hypothetical protein TEPIDINF_002544 [Tepidibacillus infernus]|uniref:hypothetical protein n=1 Tax=Tepidibacillus infernus TaxID=1806172 RepID=UPI003B7570F0